MDTDILEYHSDPIFKGEKFGTFSTLKCRI